jgi:hypothetical protein
MWRAVSCSPVDRVPERRRRSNSSAAHSFCEHVQILPEAAGIVFGGGFPRRPDTLARRAAQRAIFHVQRELEDAAAGRNAAIILCDRGTVDGAAYWPSPDDFFAGVRTTLSDELRRYDAVIHLRTPPVENGYNHQNPLRTETAVEAADVRSTDPSHLGIASAAVRRGCHVPISLSRRLACSR